MILNFVCVEDILHQVGREMIKLDYVRVRDRNLLFVSIQRFDLHKVLFAKVHVHHMI